VAALTSPSAAAALEGPGEPEDLLLEPLALFKELNATRGSSGFGMGPITWQEMDAFGRVRGFPMAGWEVQLVRQMDEAMLVAAAKQAAPKE